MLGAHRARANAPGSSLALVRALVNSSCTDSRDVVGVTSSPGLVSSMREEKGPQRF